MTPSRIPLRHTALKTAARVSTLAVLLALATTARAQVEYDNFDSYTTTLDPAHWSTITNPDFPITYSFPTDVFGGHAVRMQCGVPATAVPKNGYTTARVVAVNTDNSYTDFYVAADLVAINPSADDSTNYGFTGLIARETGGVASGTNFSGVGMIYWNNHTTQSSPPQSVGAVVIGYFVNGSMSFLFPNPSAGVVPSAVAYWTLQTNHTYRMVFQGVGPNLTGSVYDTLDLTRPLGTIRGNTSLGNLGLAPVAPTSGYSGIFAAFFDGTGNTNDVTGTVDATFDNFYAAAAPPATVTAPATPIGMVGAPQVTSHTPASWANFYNSAVMTINASTLSTPNITYFRLILNGVDVSAGATPSPALPATSTTITYSGLATNTVYDAVVILEDSLNRFTTNVWTFDTFSAAYLADNSKCKNIECEDYDSSGGGLDPLPVPASGYSTNDNTWMTPPGAASPIGYYAAINVANYTGPAGAVPAGYVGLPGVNDKTTPGGDFYQSTRTAPLVGQPIVITTLTGNLTTLLPGCEYRTGAVNHDWPNFDTPGNDQGDVVGTERGAAYAISVFNVNAASPILTPQYAFDTKRAKYAALNAAGLAQYPNSGIYNYNPKALYNATGADTASWWDVEEYNVVYTEGGDWFNYTHNWGSSQYYAVYLRAACGLSQTANLYKGMTLDPSGLIGTFYCTNALKWNWRFTPLLDSNGNQAVVKLLSGSSTLRLQVAPENPQGAGVFNGLALNYMALVPIVGGSIQVNITPPAAVAADAQWQLDGGPLRNSGATVDMLPGGPHTVSFTSLLHWTTPASQQVTVIAGQTTILTGTYIPLPPTLWSTTQLKRSGTTWTQETGAIVNTTNQVVTNTLPTVSTYYQMRWDINTKVTKVSTSGANLILNFTNAVFITNISYQAGLNIRAWTNTTGCGIALDGTMFDFSNPSPAPNDSTPYDPLYFTNGLGTIGYATQSIDMPDDGPQAHFTASDSCGVAYPGPFPAGYSQNYAVEYRGQIYIATAGNYNFQTSSDDGSALWIDAGLNPTYSTAIVPNNACHGLTPKASGAQALTAGYHDIIIRYNQGGSANALQVFWDPTGGTTFVPIPGSVFFHQGGVIVLVGP